MKKHGWAGLREDRTSPRPSPACLCAVAWRRVQVAGGSAQRCRAGGHSGPLARWPSYFAGTVSLLQAFSLGEKPSAGPAVVGEA